MRFWCELAIGVLGVLVGSFLNVVIARVPSGRSVVTPRSKCPKCDGVILPRDNIPLLSWFLLRGRCRSCREPISVRYPLVELLTGLVYAAVAARFGFSAETVAFLYLATVGIALAAIDLDCHRLPNVLTLPSYVVGFVLLGVAAVIEATPMRLLGACVAMASMLVVFFALAVAKPGGMGLGDVKLSGVIGLYLGYLGVGYVLVGVFLSFLIGGIAGITLLLSGRANRRTAIPFGPALIAGTLIAIFCTPAVTGFYRAALLA